VISADLLAAIDEWGYADDGEDPLEYALYASLRADDFFDVWNHRKLRRVAPIPLALLTNRIWDVQEEAMLTAEGLRLAGADEDAVSRHFGLRCLRERCRTLLIELLTLPHEVRYGT
jgi:hypothetical protein